MEVVQDSSTVGRREVASCHMAAGMVQAYSTMWAGQDKSHEQGPASPEQGPASGGSQ